MRWLARIVPRVRDGHSRCVEKQQNLADAERQAESILARLRSRGIEVDPDRTEARRNEG